MSVTAGERRVVSVLVADVAGSTMIAERLGPERSKFLFDEVVRLMREEVERFGGTVAQLTGDGLLALFGAPVAHENDAERAVRAALAIGHAISRYSEEIGAAYGIELGVRAAVNTGPVVVPADDVPPERLYNALGDTVNVAARLQAHGELVVGADTERQLSGRFELEPLGELELKGKAHRIAAFRVLGELETAVVSPQTPFVGRESEFALLEGALAQLSAGGSAIVVVTGEPGVGKSRLKSEVRERFGDRVRFLEGHAVSYAADIPYWPIRELLRDWLGMGVSDPEARLRLELRTGLAGALGRDAEDVYPFLAGVLGLPFDTAADERLRELSRDSVQQQTFDSLYRLACALAVEQPLCLVFEDLQWADEATLGAVEALLPVTDEQPVALVLSYRTEGEHAGWDVAERARRRFRHRFLELDLDPLEPQVAAELAVRAAGAELPSAVSALLAERSGGNPFFLEEALRDLLERGVLRRTNGRFELASGGEITVPALVEETIQARLDRLAAATRELVSVASVIGRSFGLPLLEQILPSGQLRPALSELQRLDLIVEERRGPAPEYRFRHGLVQEAAYGRLVDARRRALHRAVGEALETSHRESPGEVYGLLAHHFSEADDLVRAVDYLLKSADVARGFYAETEALALYRRALSFMEGAGAEGRERETWLKIGLTHHLAFDFARAGQAFAEAFARPAPPPHPRLEPAERLAAVALQTHEGFAPGHVYSTPGWELCRHLFRGLVQITSDLDVEPDLAESWAVAEVGFSYRFVLRGDAVWSDGAPVTADDFCFTYRQMREDGLPSASLLEAVVVEATDERTLELRLREPQNALLYLLAQPPCFPWPRHAYEALGPAWRDAVPLVGNGPFVVSCRDDAGAVFTANASWYGRRGNVREIAFELDTSPHRMDERWLQGEFDARPVALAPTAATRAAKEADDMVIQSATGMGTLYLGFHAARPPLDDVRVRRALGHALDRGRLLAAGRLRHEPASGGIVPPTMPGHSHRLAPAFDPERARSLLAEAGYPEGRGLDELVIVHEEVFDFGKGVGQQLAAVGVRSRAEEVPFPDIETAIEERAHIWAWGWTADYPDPRAMLEPFQTQMPWLYWDEQLGALLAEAASLRDQDARLRCYREFERLWIGEHAALVPVSYPRQASWLRPWIEGTWVNAMATSTLAEAVVRR
jgi:ABC-type transport system substrate-binding protein/class 3 adenylate cyclase